MDFDVTAGHSIIVTALGAFDNNINGFTGTISVGIFNRTTGLQVGPSQTFTGTTLATAGNIANGDRFKAVTPFILPPGQYSIVAVGFNNTDLNGNSNVPPLPPPFTAPAENTGGGLIQFVGVGRYDNNTTLDYPTTPQTQFNSPVITNPFLAGTFQFTGIAPPSLSKSFADSQLTFTPNTTVTFTATNPNPVPLTGVGFTDQLPSGMTIAQPNGLTGSCDAGTISAPDGGTTISLSGATLGANNSTTCSFSVNVTSSVGAVGPLTNTTSTITSNEGGSGGPASATVVDNQYIYFLWWFS